MGALFEDGLRRSRRGSLYGKIEPLEFRDLAGAGSGGIFVLWKAEEAYEARARGSNRTLWSNIPLNEGSATGGNLSLIVMAADSKNGAVQDRAEVS